MKRPFFVHTPRNRYGEHLTACPWTIRSVFESKTDLVICENWMGQVYADRICKDMNDAYEAAMMAIYI